MGESKTEVMSGLYTTRDLRVILARHRKRRVPLRTLYWWFNQIGMRPTDSGVYLESDLNILVQLVAWLGRGGTVAAFAKQLKENDHAN